MEKGKSEIHVWISVDWWLKSFGLFFFSGQVKTRCNYLSVIDLTGQHICPVQIVWHGLIITDIQWNKGNTIKCNFIKVYFSILSPSRSEILTARLQTNYTTRRFQKKKAHRNIKMPKYWHIVLSQDRATGIIDNICKTVFTFTDIML